MLGTLGVMGSHPVCWGRRWGRLGVLGDKLGVGWVKERLGVLERRWECWRDAGCAGETLGMLGR